MIHAHYRNVDNSGTYAVELNKILTANKLPKVIIPESPNSHRIFSLIQEQQTDTNMKVSETKPRKSRSRERSGGEKIDKQQSRLI